MEILNVIELVDGELISLESFLILEESYKQETVEKAEKLFIEKIKENQDSQSVMFEHFSNGEKTLNEQDYDYHVECGSYIKADYQLLLTWSTTVNV